MDKHPVSCASQIAWHAHEHDDALQRAATWGIVGIEVAPSLLFADSDDPFHPSAQALAKARQAFAAYGLSTPSMQALLHGAPQAAMFGDAAARSALDARIKACIAIAADLGVPHLVFGSPKQRRVPDGMDMATANAIAGDTIARWNAWCADGQVTVGLECNPPLYGGNFWTTHDDLLSFLAHHDLPNIGLTLDIGAAGIDGVVPTDLLDQMGHRIRHVHWSAPHLATPTIDAGCCNGLRLLQRKNVHISLEMARPEGGLDALDRLFAHLSFQAADHA